MDRLNFSSCDEKFRVFEMNHVDTSSKFIQPTTGKRLCVTQMIYEKECTLDDIILECQKCVCLCRACHKIATHNQIENDEI